MSLSLIPRIANLLARSPFTSRRYLATEVNSQELARVHDKLRLLYEAGSLHDADQYWAKLQSLAPRLADLTAYTWRLRLFIKMKHHRKAVETLQDIRARNRLDQQFFLSMLQACCEFDNYVFAERLFSEMALRCVPKSVECYNCMLLLLCSRDMCGKAVAHVSDMLKEMEETQTAFNEQTFTLLIRIYSRNVDEKNAVETFNSMVDAGHIPTADVWNCIISIYNKTNKLEMAETTFTAMVDSGCEPNQMTYNIMISICYHLRFFRKLENYFHEMKQKGFVPDVVNYNCLITMLGTYGKIEDVEAVFSEMLATGVSPSERTYTTLMSIYSNHGRYKASERAFNELKLAGLTPTMVTYRTLAAMYRRSEQFDKLEAFQAEMDEAELKEKAKANPRPRSRSAR